MKSRVSHDTETHEENTRMKMIVKILSKREKPFKGDDGKMIPWYWYKAERTSDALALEIGSSQSYEESDEEEMELQKVERQDGKFWYKELV